MREQNAIDAAVFSGAAMQADALNGIISVYFCTVFQESRHLDRFIISCK